MQNPDLLKQLSERPARERLRRPPLPVIGWLIVPLMMALAVAAAGVAAATINVAAERRGDAIDVMANAVVNADAGVAWRVLTDYNRYSAFIPDLRDSRIVARHGSVVTVQQSGDAALWQLRFPLRMTFEVTEFPPDRLESRAIAGSLRSLVSSYALTLVDGHVRLDYVGHIAPGFEVFGQIEESVVRQNIARQFTALVEEIERQGAAPPEHVGAQAR